MMKKTVGKSMKLSSITNPNNELSATFKRTLRDSLKLKRVPSQCKQLHFITNIVKQWFSNKSPKQFASVSPASRPALYRVTINHRGPLAEKEAHNMQMSLWALLLHDAR